jgi:hypothetical protein
MAFTEIEQLRLYLADPDEKADGNGLVFTDEQLNNLIDLYPEDLNAAAADGWKMKAASVADWYQANTDGSKLSRQQVFDHCLKMIEKYEESAQGSIQSIRMDVMYETTGGIPEESEF